MSASAKPNVLTIFKQAVAKWSDDNALRLGAALAYYSVFSIAPLLVIAIAIAGWMFGHDAAQRLLVQQLHDLVGGKAAEGIREMVQSASKPSKSVLAGIMGTVTLLLGASGVFGELKDALNKIWGVRVKPRRGVMLYVRERLLSFGMVLVIGFLLLVSLMLTTALAGLTSYLGSAFPFSKVLLAILGFLVSYGVVTLLFAAIFKILPDAKIDWREVWIGAAVTGLLFEIGKFLLGFYLGRESTASAYGAAASAVLLLLWVYYASLILFFGAEFTQVYARASGEGIEPADNAEPVGSIALPHGSNSGKSANSNHLTPEAQPAKESPRDILGIGGPIDYEPAPPGSVSELIETKPFAVLLSAMGGGLAVGIILRRFEGGPHFSPREHIKVGLKALALTGAATAATYLSRLKAKTENSLERLDVPREIAVEEKRLRSLIRSLIRKLL